MAKRTRKTRTKKLQKGVDLTAEEKLEKARIVCDLYATDQYTLPQCLKQAGIYSDSTWYKWVKEIEVIAELYQEAQTRKGETYRSNLVTRARNRLEMFIDGWIQEVTEQEAVPGKAKEGQETPILITKVKKKQIYIKPSIRAVEFVLVNLDGKTYTKNPEPYKAGNENMPTKIEIEIKGGAIPPVTSEDDVTDIDTERYLRDQHGL